MLEVKRKKGETFESFLRRFNKRLMQSGVILYVKKHRYLKKGESRNMQNKTAILRKKYRENIQYMKKIGKLPDEPVNKRRRY